MPGPRDRAEAAKAALREHDSTRDDGLLTAMLHSFGVDSAERLARAVNDDPRVTIGVRTRLPSSRRRMPDRRPQLRSSRTLRRTSVSSSTSSWRAAAVGSTVIAAGSVIVAQPRLFDAFTAIVAARHPETSVALLGDEPVEGGVVLARRLAQSRRAR